ncbi:PREDICTED: fumarylacetoacetate hydrolase domain-containing protein 2 [Wasmannia auropunctata]|uniref:fumarylacetoacetate hydrolase domain-containing protein 2 n=1 Tax=Wasmannia auropunctata TaxID=64793 RepID=UPI0005F039F0|nr:PREDICTED: fumarylacetoacetate hydrolase domain-containing protein 2 [Wasmannia auropunctata]
MPYRGKLRLLGRVCLAFSNGKTEGNPCFAVASIAGSRNFSVSHTLDMRHDIITDARKKISNLNVNICFARNDDFDLRKAVERIVAEGRSITPEADVNFLAPVTRMDKLVCIGLNYSGHCQEQGVPTPESPVVFNKFPSNIIGPHDNILLPQISDKIDWEAELAIVIGKRCKGLNKDDVEDCIFGYTVAQDITARDWQKRNGGQFLISKAMDTFCPLGPVVVAKEAICDINNLSVRTWVNGNLKQDCKTSELIFKPHDIVAYLSQFMTLLPGDVILTGTPAGVGFRRNPPEFLQRGDVLETEIESLGRLRNKVI